MFQHNTAFFDIDIQNVLELLGDTRRSISITLGQQILVTKSCSLLTMHLMQIYVIFFFLRKVGIFAYLYLKKTNAWFQKYLTYELR